MKVLKYTHNENIIPKGIMTIKRIDGTLREGFIDKNKQFMMIDHELWINNGELWVTAIYQM